MASTAQLHFQQPSLASGWETRGPKMLGLLVSSSLLANLLQSKTQTILNFLHAKIIPSHGEGQDHWAQLGAPH